MMDGKCKYCDKTISKEYIRCDECNRIWEDGLYSGRMDIRSRLGEALTTLYNLSRTEGVNND